MKQKWLAVILAIAVVGGLVFFSQKKEKPVATTQGKVVVKVWDWGMSQKKVYDELFAQFMKENPDIVIEHSVLNSGQYDNMVQLAFKSNNTPDIFWRPNSLTFQELVDKDWIRPINEFIEKTNWKAKFPAGSFAQGHNMVGDKIYAFPGDDPTMGVVRPLYWNKKLFKEAGLSRPPKNWSELREYAKKITQVGEGKYYGFILGGKQDAVWEMNVGILASFAGNPNAAYGGMDYHQGKYDFTKPGYIEAYKLLEAMKKDGSIFPGIMALDDEQARAYFATDRAAMIIGGPWNVNGWEKYPSADYGIAPIPTPDSGIKSKIMTGSGAGGGWWLSSQTKNVKAAWKVLEFISSKEFHKVIVENGLGISIFKEANEHLKDPKVKEILDVAHQQVVRGPDPILRNSNVAMVNKFSSKVSPPKVTFALAIMDAWRGKNNIQKGLEKATAEANKFFDTKLALARKEGYKVTKKDFVFPDFNPLENYNY